MTELTLSDGDFITLTSVGSTVCVPSFESLDSLGDETSLNDTGWRPQVPVGSALGRGRTKGTQARLKQNEVEDWMHRRFAGLSPDMFCSHSIAIYSTHRLQPAPGFENQWFTINDQHKISHQLSQQEVTYLEDADAVLVFTDVQDSGHVRTAFDLAASIASLGSLAPPILLLPHSTSAESHKSGTLTEEHGPCPDALDANIDVVILGELCGLKLAGEVHSRIIQEQRQAELLNNKVNENRKIHQNMQYIEDELEEAVWEYCRIRLRTGLPPIDDDIGPGQPDTIDKFVVGAKLGQGSFGVVCRLVEPSSPTASSGQVLKMVSKAPLTNFYGINSLKREIRVMEMLSSETYSHPNITKLYEVYHTETHILFRLEDGGKLDLYKRLLMCEKRSPPSPLGVQKTTDIMTQCIAGICHLHLGPQVVHRDLKPENIIVDEQQDRLTIKVTDFDVALAAPRGRAVCTGKVGTFPFMAPEVVFDKEFDPFPADIWSIAIVLFEVICRLNVLKRGLGLIQNKKVSKSSDEQFMMGKIKNFFDSKRDAHTDMLLQKYMRPEMMSFLDDANHLLAGMLSVTAKDRFTAQDVLNESASRFVVA